MALAAARLGLSEATVTRRLKALERDLGLQLFTRAANRLVPTAIGLGLAAEAREVSAAMARFRGHARPPPGRSRARRCASPRRPRSACF